METEILPRLRATFPRSTPEECSGNAPPRQERAISSIWRAERPVSVSAQLVRRGGWGEVLVMIRSYASSEITCESSTAPWLYFARLQGVCVGGGRRSFQVSFGPSEALHRLL